MTGERAAEDQLWVELTSGKVYRVPEAAWAALRAGPLVVSNLSGERRRVSAGALRPHTLSVTGGARAVLDDPAWRAALLAAVAVAVPEAGRWLTDAAQARQATDFVAALEGGGADPVQRLEGLKQVADSLDALGGPQELGQLAARATQRALDTASPSAVDAPPTAPVLTLLASVLARAEREHPGWIQSVDWMGGAPAQTHDQLVTATRAHVASRLHLSPPPALTYADVFGAPNDPDADAPGPDEAP